MCPQVKGTSGRSAGVGSLEGCRQVPPAPLSGGSRPGASWPTWPWPLLGPSLSLPPAPGPLRGPWPLLLGASPERGTRQLLCCGRNPGLNRLTLQPLPAPPLGPWVGHICSCPSSQGRLCSISLGPGEAEEGGRVPAEEERPRPEFSRVRLGLLFQPALGGGGERGGNRCRFSKKPVSSQGIVISL